MESLTMYDRIAKFGSFVENLDTIFSILVKKVTINYDVFIRALREFLEKEAFHLYTKCKSSIRIPWDEEYVMRIKNEDTWSVYIYKNAPIKIYWDDEEAKIAVPLSFNLDALIKKLNKYVVIPKSFDIADSFASSVYYYSRAQQEIVKSIQFWLSKRDWFLERGIPYKRTYLLKGPPGTGKSSFIRRVASVTGYSLSIIDVVGKFADRTPYRKGFRAKGFLNGDGEEMDAEPEKVESIKGGRRILVIEDLDRVDLTKIRMDKLMNFLQGSESQEGLICFITCNDDMVFPEALLRAGRIDKEVTFGRFEEDGLKFIAKKVFNEERQQEIVDKYKDKTSALLLKADEELAELSKQDKTKEVLDKVKEISVHKQRLSKELFTPAHFEQYCVETAIQEFEEQAKSL